MELAYIYAQQRIAADLGFNADAVPETEYPRRRDFIADYLLRSGAEALVLGISGGVDSTTTGMLCQLAINQLKSLGGTGPRQFIAVRLPYGEQRDEDEAQMALATIRPDLVITVNIKPAVDAAMSSLILSGVLDGKTPAQIDFIKGNEKARERMKVQYSIAAAYNGLVVGTDHAAEALMGFFTKQGDGAADIVPMAGLDKEQVRELAAYLGVPFQLAQKPPTADLEDLDPGKLDETAFGVTYDQIGNFLRGLPLPQYAFDAIITQYRKTAHKRALPVGPQ